MSDFQVGDVVTWRDGKSRCKPDFMPLGIAGCRVMQLGILRDEQPAAVIGFSWGGDYITTPALIADLEASDA